MFRNPRENKDKDAIDAVAPAVGRPPSPHRHALSPAVPASSQTSDPLPPTLRQASMTTAKAHPKALKSTPVKNGKSKALANGSILSFFQKADKVGETLFVENSPEKQRQPVLSSGSLLVGLDNGCAGGSIEEERARFNESPGSSKKRKLSHTSEDCDQLRQSSDETDADASATSFAPPPSHFDSKYNPANADEVRRNELATMGGFVDESDSEDDEQWAQASRRTDCIPSETLLTEEEEHEGGKGLCSSVRGEGDAPEEATGVNGHQHPPLRRASTSMPDQSGFDEFDGLGDFEDEWEEGEEFVERRYMQEQERLEREAASQAENDDNEDSSDRELKNEPGEGYDTVPDDDAESGQPIAACPICSIALDGVSDQDASVHVNDCLDGNPTPLSSQKPKMQPQSHTPPSDEEGMSRSSSFKRPVRPPKPGQKNPFELGTAKGTGSAFSRLMSGHAEDAAWADAAAEENKSRGKPAYQRTCPFYKILPGFYIAVDAFRYGAVEGCNAYFLSHFHSDHYVGLTQTWSHGPIYCSRPTANLVKQQLKVNPKYVLALEWEKRVEVPGTQGVFVTMIPANHCPGSSLYLFEKIIGKGPNPKAQRVLHCGDFRACPAHVTHPLLMPEVREAVTGKTAQQRIDVCYLDTTYCNPKWAFPSQEDVIQAVADMCVSLNNDKVDKNDEWEKAKKARAGGAMAKFVRTESMDENKENNDESLTGKHRGKLLVVVGTYSIGKERICLGIARALKSKIYAPAGKQRICQALEDTELLSRLTSDPREAQVHMTPLFEIRAETLEEYLKDFRDRFSRAVGFRPTGWNYRPPGSRFTESPSVTDVLHSANWKSTYSMKDLVPQRGSNQRASCFGVPYSEHSSFRELSMFCCALRIDKIIPTVNVGGAKSRERMKVWCERWAAERKKNGLFKPVSEDGKSAWYPGKGTWELRTTL